jgi:hypothetical protein
MSDLLHKTIILDIIESHRPAMLQFRLAFWVLYFEFKQVCIIPIQARLPLAALQILISAATVRVVTIPYNNRLTYSSDRLDIV